MSDPTLRLETAHGEVLEGCVMGNGGYASADVVRREIALVEGREDGASRIYRPAPDSCMVHLRSEAWRAGNDPKGHAVVKLRGLKVEDITNG